MTPQERARALFPVQRIPGDEHPEWWVCYGDRLLSMHALESAATAARDRLAGHVADAISRAVDEARAQVAAACAAICDDGAASAHRVARHVGQDPERAALHAMRANVAEECAALIRAMRLTGG